MARKASRWSLGAGISSGGLARFAVVLLTPALLWAPIAATKEQTVEIPQLPARNPEPRPKTAEEAAYFEKLDDYRKQRDIFDRAAEAYWERVSETRSKRRKKRAEGLPIGLNDYVLEQPPVYRGPPEPTPPPSLVTPKPPVEPRPIPVLADFLEQAKTHFAFAPETPASEGDFKRGYAEAALAAGIAKDQAVRIYGFEASGNGRYDVQAGLETPGPRRRAISTALGYNQLLVPNTIGLLAEHGDDFVAILNERLKGAAAERRAPLEGKIAALKRMIRFSQTVPAAWSAHVALARTPKGWGVHALNLDIDIGPLLQAQKLANSLAFARRKGLQQRLSAAELEMLNLMGDGSGFDVVSMPAAIRDQVPTSNMFDRGGYERNSIVRRHNTVAALLAAVDAKMDSQAALPGSREMEAAFDAAAARLRERASAASGTAARSPEASQKPGAAR